MNHIAAPDITQLLLKWRDGEDAAIEELMPLVYSELHRLADRHLRHERADHTLSPTALVHEAFLNLVNQSQIKLESRGHFFAIASRVMRRVLIWYARRRNASKRGGGAIALSLNDLDILSDYRSEELLALDQALERLEHLDDRLCRVVECRYFGGLSIEETALALRISPATVKRDWQTARAWLRAELQP